MRAFFTTMLSVEGPGMGVGPVGSHVFITSYLMSSLKPSCVKWARECRFTLTLWTKICTVGYTEAKPCMIAPGGS
jgi:hypothetical protein